VLRAAKCRFGIIFSKNGISGLGKLKYAEREILKIKQDGIIIVTVTEADLREVAAGANYFSLLRDLYEREHLDLQTAKKLTRKSKQKK
jgi:hypothetical protein